MKKALALLSLALLPSMAMADEAAALFKSKCAACHGATGAGDTAMGQKLGVKPLGSADVQKKSDDQLQQVIIKGSGKMPGFGSRLSAGDVKALIAFIRTLKK